MLRKVHSKNGFRRFYLMNNIIDGYYWSHSQIEWKYFGIGRPNDALNN